MNTENDFNPNQLTLFDFIRPEISIDKPIRLIELDCKHHDGSRCFRWNSTIITGFDDYCSKAELRGEQDE